MPVAAASTAPAPDVIAVDWSGRREGERRAIWLAAAAGGRLVALEGGRTRAQVIDEIIAGKQRWPDGLVVGLDFAFSLPRWYVEHLGCRAAYDLWCLVEEEGESWLAACDPPWWGRPGRRRPELAGHLRATEAAHKGSISPKSVFQIGGAGAVGTGSLRGMPHLRRLHDAGFSIWPFDPPSPWLVVEIYPRLLTGAVVKSRADARAAYLGARSGALGPQLADVAGASEDAFDAAVSALAMSRHRSSLATLARATDTTTLLEGAIWNPGPDRTACD